jgi:hypothetical protein
MRVQELMTTPALSIGPEASLKDVATTFIEALGWTVSALT